MKTTDLNLLLNYLIENKISIRIDEVDDNLTTLEIKYKNRNLYFNIIKRKNKTKIYYVIFDETDEVHVFMKLSNINDIIYILRNINQ